MKITIELDTDELVDIKGVIDQLIEEYMLTLQDAYRPVSEVVQAGQRVEVYPYQWSGTLTGSPP